MVEVKVFLRLLETADISSYVAIPNGTQTGETKRQRSRDEQLPGSSGATVMGKMG